MAIPSVLKELVGVVVGFGTGIPLGLLVHRLLRDPERRGLWRARLAFWCAWFSGALASQSLALAIAGPREVVGATGSVVAGTPMPWSDAIAGSAALASIFTVIYALKFKSGMNRAPARPSAPDRETR